MKSPKFRKLGGNPKQNCKNLVGTPTPNSEKCKFLIAQAAKVDSPTSNPGLRHPQPHQKSGGKEKKTTKITFLKKKKVGVKKVGDESEKKSS